MAARFDNHGFIKGASPVMMTIAPGCVGLESAGMTLTTEEFDAIANYDEDYRYELIRGVLVVSPFPSEAECDANEELGFLLRNYQYRHPHGSALDKTLSERYVITANRRRADRVIWVGLGRVPAPKGDPPAIVVEFVSSSRRDRRRDYEEKRSEYLEAGVHEYWIIDRFRRTMTVFLNRPEGVEEVTIPETGTCRTELLPGFELPLARLLAVADDWRAGS
jgi:Uma2 family endonuclease